MSVRTIFQKSLRCLSKTAILDDAYDCLSIFVTKMEDCICAKTACSNVKTMLKATESNHSLFLKKDFSGMVYLCMFVSTKGDERDKM
mgnify:CR=1 FL=1